MRGVLLLLLPVTVERALFLSLTYLLTLSFPTLSVIRLCLVLRCAALRLEGLRHYEEFTELVQQPVLRRGDVVFFTEVWSACEQSTHVSQLLRAILMMLSSRLNSYCVIV